MSQDDIPKVDSINISKHPNEVDYDMTLGILMERSEDGNVLLPFVQYMMLAPRMEYIVGQIIHSNYIILCVTQNVINIVRVIMLTIVILVLSLQANLILGLRLNIQGIQI